MENDGKRTVHTRNVGIFLPRKIKSKKKFREEAQKERQARIQGQWQQESPAREYLEQVKCCNDANCTHRMMKHGFFALKSEEWEKNKNTFRNEVKVTEWAFDRMKLSRRWRRMRQEF